MKNFHRSIIVVIVAFVAVVGFAPQAKAFDVDGITAATRCRTAEKDCEPGELCIRENEDDKAGLCLDCRTAEQDCEPGEFCIDGLCVECEIDADCSDDGFCAEGACVECLLDADCGEGEICGDNVCVVEPECPEAIALWDEDGNCLLSKDELKTYNDTLKATQKAEKNILKEKQSAEKDEYKTIKKSEYAE